MAKGFSPYASLTFYTFGLIIIATNIYRYRLIGGINDMLFAEFIVAGLFIVNAFVLRDKNWSLFQHAKQKVRERDYVKKKKVNYINEYSEYYKRMR